VWELLMMAEALPRLEALDTLREFEAVALGSGMMKEGRERLREIARVASGEGEDRRERSASPLEALARLSEANARARERGDLWEQRIERGEVASRG
jgi:hypothetical protein